MAKKSNKKSNYNVGNEREIEQEYFPLIEKGEDIADVLMNIMKMVATDWEGIGAMAYGMAKSLAALKETAKRTDTSIDNLHEHLVSYFQADIAKLLDEHNM